MKNKLSPQARAMLRAAGFAYVMGVKLHGEEKNRDVAELIRIMVMAAQRVKP